MFEVDGSAQTIDILRSVGTLNAAPPRIVLPCGGYVEVSLNGHRGCPFVIEIV
jgi:hypothetical protein